MLSDNEDLANLDERLAAMIAQIVEAYGRYNSSRGPSYSSYQALKAMSLDDLEGRLLAGLLAPYGDEPTPTQEQIAKALAAQRIAQLRRMVEARDQAAHRRAARPRPRADVRRPAAGRERRVPARLGRAAAADAPGGGAAGAHAGHPAGRPPAAVARGRDRSAQDAAQVDVHRRRADRRGAARSRIRPGRSWWCCATCPVRWPGFSHFTLLLVHALRQQFSRVRVFAFIDTTDEVTELFGPDADLAVAVQRITREAGVYTRDGHSDYGHAFVSFLDKYPNVLSPRSSLLVLGDGRNNYRNPEIDLLRAHGQRRAGTRTGSTPSPGTCGAAAIRRCRATRTSSPCTNAARPSSWPR